MIPVVQEKELGVPPLKGLFLPPLSFGVAVKLGEFVNFVLRHHQKVEDVGNVFIIDGVPDGVFWRKGKYIFKDMF